MSKLKVLLLALTLPVLVFAAVQAQQGTKGTLTALDYAEIQQLYGRYAIGYDSGNGDMFARAFTPDGTFQLPNTVIAGRGGRSWQRLPGNPEATRARRTCCTLSRT